MIYVAPSAAAHGLRCSTRDALTNSASCTGPAWLWVSARVAHSAPEGAKALRRAVITPIPSRPHRRAGWRSLTVGIRRKLRATTGLASASYLSHATARARSPPTLWLFSRNARHIGQHEQTMRPAILSKGEPALPTAAAAWELTSTTPPCHFELLAEPRVAASRASSSSADNPSSIAPAYCPGASVEVGEGEVPHRSHHRIREQCVVPRPEACWCRSLPPSACRQDFAISHPSRTRPRSE